MSSSSNRESSRVRFPGGNGFMLAGIMEAPTGDPLATAVFSHCFTCGKDLKMIVRVSRLLAERGIAVLRFDMTGLGESEGGFSETNFTSNTQDLLAACEFARPQFLIGHSFGGAASLAVAQQLDDVAGVITLAAPSDTFHLADVLAKMNPEIERSGRGDVVIGGRSFTITSQMLQDFRQYDLTSRLPLIDKWILALHSPADETVAYHHASGIVQSQAPGNPARRSLITLPDSDHLFIKNEADIPFVAQLVACWIERITLTID